MMKPEEIERASFEIIDREAGPHNFSDQQWCVVRRMIHTTADFEFKEMVRFHPDAMAAGIGAIRQGRAIITDTNMAAKNNGTTRARAAVDMAVADMAGGIYVVGNAPTALLRLLELIHEKKAHPALIVGLPVGFVNAAESKADLMETGYPYISNVGRKGGSNVAASVVNALAILAGEVQGAQGKAQRA